MSVEPAHEITLWQPEPDVILHQAIGKLGEEVNELGAIVFRSLIQGVDGRDPKTHKSNREALAEEIADVLAAIIWVRELARLPDGISARTGRKLDGYRRWQGMLEAHANG